MGLEAGAGGGALIEFVPQNNAFVEYAVWLKTLVDC